MRRRFGESLLFMVMIAVLILLPVRMASAEGPLERPKANMEVSGLVPFAFLNKIALKKAQERWGQVALGPPLACVDDDGDIVAYMFPFSIGPSSFPAYSEILSSVKEGRRIAREGFKAMNPWNPLIHGTANGAGLRERPGEGSNGPLWRRGSCSAVWRCRKDR